MPKATRKNITSEKKCPAALMADLIGAHMKLHDDLIRLSPEDARSESWADTAFRLQSAAADAIAFAPARSLRGAIAKLILSQYMLGEIIDDKQMPLHEVGRNEFLSRALTEDALACLARLHGITAENLGVGSYLCNGPTESLQRARAHIAKVAATSTQDA